MSDIGSTGNGRIQPRPGAIGGGIASPNRGGGGAAQGRSDPLPQPLGDLEGAFQRLRALLAFDGDGGPRADVRSRGYYLNILV